MSNEKLVVGDFVIYYEGHSKYIGQLAQIIEVNPWQYQLKFSDNNILYPPRSRRLLKHNPTEEQLATYIAGIMKS